MAEPLNTYTLEHYLDFKSDDIGLVRIDEPIGFDASDFVIEQRSDGYGRDISFSGEESEFTFGSDQGLFQSPLTNLLRYDKEYGFEANVNYILREGAEDYVVGRLDFATKVTDEKYYFTCVITQCTTQALLKRREGASVKLFSDEDLDGNPIMPVATSNILVKAKPVVQSSEWGIPQSQTFFTSLLTGGTQIGYYNFCVSQISNSSSIEDSLNYIPGFSSDRNDFKYVRAVNDLTDVSIDLNIDLSFTKTSGTITSGTIKLRYFISSREYDGTFNSTDDIAIGTFFEGTIDNTSTYSINDSITIDTFNSANLTIPRGTVLLIWFEQEIASTTAGEAGATINEMSIEITGKATAIDSVIKGVRLIDAIRQVSSSISQDFTVDAPRYEAGGEWYDNFVFSGNMLRGRDTFSLDWKGILSGLQELNSDYEVNNTTVFVGKYDDFYTNNDIGAFEINPNESYNSSFNEKYTINQFEFNYKDFNQDKDDQNTIDAVHTESQWLNANKQVENFKEVEVGFIRDPFLLETTRKKAISDDSNSLTQDDKTFIVDVVPLAPSSRGGFTANLTHFVNDDGDLQMLNDGSFNWGLLGFVVGDDFVINNTQNSGTYTVLEFTQTIITLSGSPTFTGDMLTDVDYPLTNVAFTIRTNEGFDFIEGILSPEDYANLRYTIKRNVLDNWGSYLATSTLYNQTTIRNTYFKNEPETGFNLRSQFNGGDIIVENANIEQSELSTPLLTPRLIKTTVLCDFSTYRDFANKLNTERGFVRIYDNNFKLLKGFTKKSSFRWADNLLELELEEKFESDVTTITFENDSYRINEVGYPLDIVPELITRSEGDYIQLFDALTRPLTNKTRFNKVSVNGVVYDSIVELQDAILSL